MIDLHTHTLWSDGVLLPAELIRRAEVIGYRGLGITDHVDGSNLELVVERLLRVCQELAPRVGLRLVPGVELTHVPPALIGPLVERARRLGARLVVVHGETLAEPVAPGTNRAAIEAGADVLAHPGLITFEEAELAARRGVALEVSARRGHCLANGHVVQMARRAGAPLVLNTDAHAPSDLLDLQQALRVARGAGLAPQEVDRLWRTAEEILQRCAL